MHLLTLAPMAAANSSIRAAALQHRRRAVARARVDLPLRLLDRMLDDLEQMNLHGRKRVPLSFEARITELAEVLPPEAGDLPSMRANVSPVRLMDLVFDLQERLMAMRSGRRGWVAMEGDPAAA